MFAAMGLGLCSLGCWPVLWNYMERRGCNPRHIYMDYAAAYLTMAAVSALTLGQFGHSASDQQPNFIQQLPQKNAEAVLFAVAGGVCMGIGDAAMQYAVALLGLAVAPAIINSLIVVVGKPYAFYGYVSSHAPDGHHKQHRTSYIARPRKCS